MLEIDVPDVIATSKKQIIDQACDVLLKKYKRCFSSSTACRPPNLNLSILRNSLFRSNVIDTRSIQTPDELVALLEEVNTELKTLPQDSWPSSRTRALSKARYCILHVNLLFIYYSKCLLTQALCLTLWSFMTWTTSLSDTPTLLLTGQKSHTVPIAGKMVSFLEWQLRGLMIYAEVSRKPMTHLSWTDEAWKGLHPEHLAFVWQQTIFRELGAGSNYYSRFYYT